MKRLANAFTDGVTIVFSITGFQFSTINPLSDFTGQPLDAQLFFFAVQ
jgi:hypothetical protein